MVEVLTQSDLRQVRDLPFCHACAKEFSENDRTDRDHIPAQACFDKADRNPPLKLKSHVSCNNTHKLNDEKVGELIAIQRRKSTDSARHLKVGLFNEVHTGRLVGAVHNLDIMGCIRRWVGGFHAALYRKPLNPRALFQITPPLPYANIKGSIAVEPIPAHVTHFVHTLKLNRAARNLDRVVTNNGKMRFEAVWVQDDHQQHWMCVWALDLYGWIGLGDQRFGRRGCIGAYMGDDGRAPDAASRGTRLEASVSNQDTFDAFGN